MGYKIKMLARIISSLRKYIARRRAGLPPPDMVDVKELIERHTIEELCQRADEYYLKRESNDYLFAKPLINAEEAPHLLINFAKALQGLDIHEGSVVLDFAAGSCWTSRFLTQLGAKVIALDVSRSALEMGKELYAMHKVIGDRPEPAFMVFDGRVIDLPSASVDRILCMDAFHHTPNPNDILKEMWRVLKEGGIACFVEPSDEHSKSPQSQMEMKNYTVIEDDIIMRDLWAGARAAGFSQIKFSVYNVDPFIISLEEYETLQEYPGITALKYYRRLRGEINSRNTFFLYKGLPHSADSRNIKGLKARLKVSLGSAMAREGGFFPATVTITNEGSSHWLPASEQDGGVNLGVHLLSADNKTIELDYFRMAPPYDNAHPIKPGQSVTLSMDIPAPPRGKYMLEFDMVAENVSWFAFNSSKTVKKEVKVQ